MKFLLSCFITVQAKYGVGDQTTLLVVVPSHIPQGIDFFNGKKHISSSLGRHTFEMSSIVQVDVLLPKEVQQYGVELKLARCVLFFR